MILLLVGGIIYGTYPSLFDEGDPPPRVIIPYGTYPIYNIDGDNVVAIIIYLFTMSNLMFAKLTQKCDRMTIKVIRDGVYVTRYSLYKQGKLVLEIWNRYDGNYTFVYFTEDGDCNGSDLIDAEGTILDSELGEFDPRIGRNILDVIK